MNNRTCAGPAHVLCKTAFGLLYHALEETQFQYLEFDDTQCPLDAQHQLIRLATTIFECDIPHDYVLSSATVRQERAGSPTATIERVYLEPTIEYGVSLKSEFIGTFIG